MNSFEGGANGCDCPRDLPPPPPPFLPVKLPLLRLLDFNDFNDDPLARSTLRFSLGGGLVVVVIIIKSFAVPTYPHSEGTEREGHAGLQFVCVRVGGFCTRTSAAFVVVVILKSERNTNENMMRRRRARYAPTSFCISPFEKKTTLLPIIIIIVAVLSSSPRVFSLCERSSIARARCIRLTKKV